MLKEKTDEGKRGPSFAVKCDMRVSTIVCCAVLMSTTEIAAQSPVLNDVASGQIMLDRAGFSPGEIDGRAGGNTEQAIDAFQDANGLPVTGQLDSATAGKLAEVNPPPGLVTYTIVADDVAGPFTPN